MKNKLFICVFTLLSLYACKNKTSYDEPFITDIRIEETGQRLHPGDLVHIYGNGFQENDQTELEFRWNTGDELLPEGFNGPVTVEPTKRNPDEIVIRMPYRMPESRVEIFLRRNEDRMSLGKIQLADSMTPKDFRLYGLNTAGNAIETIYADSGTEMKKWGTEAHANFHSLANCTMTYGLCGLAGENGTAEPFFFDFCTGEWKALDAYSLKHTLALVDLGGNSVAAIQSIEETDKYILNNVSDELERSNWAVPSRSNTPPLPALHELPEGYAPEEFGDYPGVTMEGNKIALLSADKGEGQWGLVLYELTSGFHVLKEMEAGAIIPFYFRVETSAAETPARQHKMAGYVISSPSSGDESLFCLLNDEEPGLEKPFTTLPGKVISITHRPDRFGTLTVLVENNGKRSVCEYDWNRKSWETYPELSDVTYESVVWAN